MFGSLDNTDFDDKNTIAGTAESEHVTSVVLYQAINAKPDPKPSVSSLGLKKSKLKLPEKLPCQEVPDFLKPSHKPSLPPTFKLKDRKTSVVDTQAALREANLDEFLISLLRCGQKKTPNDSLIPPTWHGAHALISVAKPPIVRVAFTPIVPKPVTDYATVRKVLQNMQNYRKMINPSQTCIPVNSDEGVYHTVADILMEEHETFHDIHGVLAFFHSIKIILKCNGRYLRGSGFDEALTMNEIFGKLVINQVLEGTHYVRALYGILLINDLVVCMIYEGFWEHCVENDIRFDENLIDSIANVRDLLCKKQRCPEEFHELKALIVSTNLKPQFDEYLKHCTGRSEVCEYLNVFLKMSDLTKHGVASDREGNFDLHLAVAEAVLPLYREFDCLSYLRYGTHYLESTRALEDKHPEVFTKLREGYFVVNERDTGYFNAVAPDLKHEQTTQRKAKSMGGTVGNSRNPSYLNEWYLVMHEVVAISNNLRGIMHEKSMSHSEFESIHHDLVGTKAYTLHENLIKLLSFMAVKGNPFVVKEPIIKLHNVINRQLVDSKISERLLQLFENGDKCVQEFREERFVLRTKKLGYTISKRSLPGMDLKPNQSDLVTSVTITKKMIASAQRNIDTAKERGMTLREIYRHDFLPTSTLFEGKLPKKPAKSQFVNVLRDICGLKADDLTAPQCEKITVLIDFMSRVRTVSAKTCETVGDLITSAVLPICKKFNPETLHIIRDSYLEESLKSCERLIRADGVEPIEFQNFSSDLSLPTDMNRFWVHQPNKEELQNCIPEIVNGLQELTNTNIIVSGRVYDSGDTVPAVLVPAGRNPAAPQFQLIPGLQSAIEEADDRIFPHIQFEVLKGQENVLLISNDTDTVARSLYHVVSLKAKGLKSLWLQYGTGESMAYLPIHKMHTV